MARPGALVSPAVFLDREASMTTAISDWQDQADAKISADCSWRRRVFESTGWHRGDRLTDLGAAAARRPSEAGVQIGGYTRVRRAEGLLRSVIGAVVQGTRRRENPSLECGHRFLGLVRESGAVLQGPSADNTKAYWSAHKAFHETSVREPMAALLDELSGEFGPISRRT
jgi:hypothetical protein